MIEITNVSKAFGGVLAVNRCSLAVSTGTVTGLIGPNGAGKSTLFAMVAGFLRPDAGRIRLGGRDVTGWPPHRVFAHGLVRTFQVPHGFPRLTVRENLMMVPAGQAGEGLLGAWLPGGQVRDQERRIGARADEVLEILDLTALADLPAGHLSGGQKKLLELGRAMMADAPVVLLDEPGAGVNRTLLGRLCEVIRRLNRDHGRTFWIVEHDMDLVAELCDPVMVMAGGRVIAEGTLADVRREEHVREAYLGGGSREP